MTQKSYWKIRGFPNEVGSIGEKVAKKWLENKGYRVYFFQDVMGLFAHLRITKLQMERRRKEEYKENDRKLVLKIETLLKNAFGQSFEDLKRFDEAIRKLAKDEEENRITHGIKKVRAIGFDFIAKKDDNITFIDVKVNQAELKKYQEFSAEIAKRHDFKAMVLRLNVEIEVKNSIQLIDCGELYGEGNG